MDCEVLLPAKIGRSGSRMLRAMIAAAPKAGVRCTVSESYRAQAPVLMSYGLGHPERRRATTAHIRNGGRLIGLDLGYWDRDATMRVTLDSDHPRAMPAMPASRWNAAGIALRDEFDPDGPIVLVGLGRKSRAQFGLMGQQWEMRTLDRIRSAYPGRPVIYRPKKPEALAGCRSADGPIEDVLRGASLVVCRHSNVAVEACIAGVPVVCEDGAAVALYGSDLRAPVNPGRERRRRFLKDLAWWQWRPDEAVEAWRFLKPLCA
jgi:hypothetical protein